MPKKEVKQQRFCKDCKSLILYIPRRTSCIECYKKKTNWTKPIDAKAEEINFINDDD